MINNSFYKSAMIASLMASSLLVAGCGSSTSSDLASIGATTVSKGVITGFGSIYVNGIKFETDDSDFDIDDNAETTQDNLRIGMVVTINGTLNADGVTGQATLIQYDNELKGPISSITEIDLFTKELIVLGRTITVTTDTVFDDDDNESALTFVTLAEGIVIEVSGLVTDAGIIATHIEQQDASNSDGEIEILGPIANLTGSSLNDITFTVYGFPVSTNSLTELDDLQLAGLQDGVFVEVEGVLDGAGTILLASEIEAKNEGLGKDDIDEAEIEGLVSNYNDVAMTFEIQGQAINASSAVFFPSSLVLADGITVEAEGSIVGGILMAYEVKQKGNKIKIEAKIKAIDTDNGTITFDLNETDIVVRVNAQTEIEGSNDEVLTLADLQAGDFVEMKAFDDGTSTINAYELERDNDVNNDVEIEAAVEAFDEINSTITLLGVEFDLTNANFDSGSISNFFSQLSIGEFVEIKDNNGTGVINEVGFDD